MLKLVCIQLLLAILAAEADEISENFPDFKRIENILSSSNADKDTNSDFARRKRAGDGKEQTSTEKPQYGPDSEKEKEERFAWFGKEMKENARRILSMKGEAEASRRMRQVEAIFNPIKRDPRALLPYHGPLDRITTHPHSSLMPDETIMFDSMDKLKATPHLHSALYDPLANEPFPLRKKRSISEAEMAPQKGQRPNLSTTPTLVRAVRRRKRSLFTENGIVDHSTYNPPHFHRLQNVVRSNRDILPHFDVTHQQTTHPLYPYGLFNPYEDNFQEQRDLFLKQDDAFRRSFPSFSARHTIFPASG